MKRIALVLVAALLLALCACGETEALESTTESKTTIVASNRESVILKMIQADWDDWAYIYDYEPPKPKDLGTQIVEVGNAVSFHTWCGDAIITVTSSEAEAVTVRFQTSGMVKPYTDETDWIVVIPYGEAYRIISDSFDGGTSLIFTFFKTH